MDNKFIKIVKNESELNHFAYEDNDSIANNYPSRIMSTSFKRPESYPALAIKTAIPLVVLQGTIANHFSICTECISLKEIFDFKFDADFKGMLK